MVGSKTRFELTWIMSLGHDGLLCPNHTVSFVWSSYRGERPDSIRGKLSSLNRVSSRPPTKTKGPT